MILIFMLRLQYVCFVRPLSCSIRLYRIARVIFPESDLRGHVPRGFLIYEAFSHESEWNKRGAAPVVLDKWKDVYELQKTYSSDGCSYC
jgi:hypothetical protein